MADPFEEQYAHLDGLEDAPSWYRRPEQFLAPDELMIVERRRQAKVFLNGKPVLYELRALRDGTQSSFTAAHIYAREFTHARNAHEATQATLRASRFWVIMRDTFPDLETRELTADDIHLALRNYLASAYRPGRDPRDTSAMEAEVMACVRTIKAATDSWPGVKDPVAIERREPDVTDLIVMTAIAEYKGHVASARNHIVERFATLSEPRALPKRLTAQWSNS